MHHLKLRFLNILQFQLLGEFKLCLNSPKEHGVICRVINRAKPQSHVKSAQNRIEAYFQKRGTALLETKQGSTPIVFKHSKVQLVATAKLNCFKPS